MTLQIDPTLNETNTAHIVIMATYVCGQNISVSIEKMKTAVLSVEVAIITMTLKFSYL